MHVEPHSWVVDDLLRVPAPNPRTVLVFTIGTLHLYDDLCSYQAIFAMEIIPCTVRPAYHEASHVRSQTRSIAQDIDQ
jgi:hypothetical protein